MQTVQDFDIETRKLDFLWMELTSQCNLRCVHCYAESEPVPQTEDKLTAENYHSLIDSAADLDCRKIQFIGGEPTLNPELPNLIQHARAVGFEFIEVFTNATRISPELLKCFINNKVCVATSFYSHIESVHDSITKKQGSFMSTVKNLKMLLSAGIQLRAGIIKMERNEDEIEKTIAFLRSIGVEQIGTDRVRSFGRGREIICNNTDSELSELCGSCWRGSVCISPDGKATPCIMAKRWSVGSVLETDLATVVRSDELKHLRQRIHDEVWLPAYSKSVEYESSHRVGIMRNGECGPECRPNCVPSCNPQCSPNCSPCFPYGKCNPKLFGR
jgi:MoaA/NifB/PqqE/SkfB family radical SAM enzyme